MKKILIVSLIFIFIGIFFYKYRVKNNFSIWSSKKISKSIEDLEDEALDAEKKFKNELQSADKVGYTSARLGEKYLDRKDWTPAIKTLRKAIEYGKSSAKVHFLLAVAYANRGKDLAERSDIEKAEEHYRNAIKINPKMYDAHYGLAILKFYLKKEMDSGISIVKKIVADNPNYYRGRFALARFYYEKREPVKALSVYEELYSDLSDKPESPKINEYRTSCKKNINRLEMELHGRLK